MAEAQVLMEDHGGWVDDMSELLGCEGTVTRVMSGDKVRVDQPGLSSGYVWNTALVEKLN